MNVIVTGGAGFIGSNLAEELLKIGDEVIVIDDFSNGKEKNLAKHKNLKVVRKSILDEDIKENFNGIDVVYHLAALPRVQFSIVNPEETHEVNVNGTLKLLEICKEKNVKRFIFSSSSSVYGNQKKLPLREDMNPNPISPYALHKLVGEHYCRLYHLLYGIETLSLRYFNVYGPKQDPSGQYAILIPKFINNALSGKELVINGDGNQTRDFTFVNDVVKANILAGTSKNENIFGKTFNIGAGNNKSVNEVTKIIINLAGSKVKVVHGPNVVEPKNTLADISRSKEFLNWQPEIEFEEGIKRTFEFFKS